VHLAAIVVLATAARTAAARTSADDAPDVAPRRDCPAARCVAWSSVARSRGERTPIAGAVVVVIAEPTTRRPGEVARSEHVTPRPRAWQRTATTDAEGRFTFDAVPAGRVRVIVVDPAHEPSQWTIDTTARTQPLFVAPSEDDGFRTVVRQRTEPPIAVGTTTLSPAELARLPGSQGDPLRALQSLPGVARAPAGLGLLVLRGAAPNQSKVFYGEHPLPRAFHTLGFTSIVQADVLDSLDLQASNFSPRWGNASGGVVLLSPRAGRRDRDRGFAKIDLLSAGALAEGAMGKGTFLVAAQRGYVDGVLRLAERVDPTQAFALPQYFDYQAQFEVSKRNTQYTVRWLGSGDRMQLRYLVAEGERVTAADLRDQFHRVELVTTSRLGPWRILATPAVRLDLATSNSDYARDRRRGVVPSWRAEVSRAMTPQTTITFGTDGMVAAYATRSFLQESSGRAGEVVDFDLVDTSLGVYAWAALRVGTATFWPGVRTSVFSRTSRDGDGVERVRHRSAVDPRLIARWDLGRRWALRGGVGLYAQTDAMFDSGSDNLVGNEESLSTARVLLPPALRLVLDPGVGVGGQDRTPDPLQAFQASGGVSFSGRRRTSIDATAFMRMLHEPRSLRQAVSGSVYTSQTLGRSFGLELLVRQQFGRRFFGWIGYTVMRSETGRQRSGWRAERWTPSDYDQRHSVVALASVDLPQSFRIGGRFRLVTGSPYTPIVGSVVSPMGYLPVSGRTNSERFPTFHQLDIRVDRRWLARRIVVTAYIDIQNVYNRKNAEALIYSDDYREISDSVGLPIFPSLGVRIDW
jgi:hypothetical protein